MKNRIKFAERTPWDNEEDEDVGEVEDEVEDDGVPSPGDPKGKGRTFTQEDVDKIVDKRNKSVKAQLAQAEEAYQTLLKQTNLTKTQRDEFEAKLENIQNQMRTKQEQLKYESEKAAQAHEAKIKEVEEKANKYQSLFEQSTIERAIIDAALSEDGFSGEQFVSYLSPRAKIVEEVTQDGENTGRLVPRIDWTITNEEGKQEVVRMAPHEVVKLMREDVDKYGNMFKSGLKQGIGSGNSPNEHGRTGKVDPRKISMADYMKLSETKEGRIALGLEKG